MTSIVVLGAGRVGGTLGVRWAEKGHRIIFGVPDPADEAVRGVRAQCGALGSAVTVPEAAAASRVILLAIPWDVTREVLESIEPLAGKIVIDCINPVKPDFSGLDPEAAPSAAERIASWAPGAKVVKAFNTLSDATMANPRYGDEQAAMFYCGDDEEAKAVARQLAEELEFEPIDSGPLKNAGHLESLAMLYMHLAIFGFEGWTDRSTIETPTLLLCGDGDFFVNQERLDYTCGLMPDCEVHPLIEGAGAFIGLEQPEAYAAAIIEFLKRP